MDPGAAADVLAIQNLVARYGLLLDVEDMDAWGRLWAADGEIHAFRSVWTGPDEIVANIRQADHGLHMGGIPDITVDGDRATGRQNFVFVEADGHALRIGWYEDVFVRLADGWRFSSRTIRFMKPAKKPDAPPPVRS